MVKLTVIGKIDRSTVLKVDSSRCQKGGKFVAVIQLNRVLFAHVNTPLLNVIWMKNYTYNDGSNVDVMPFFSPTPTVS